MFDKLREEKYEELEISCFLCNTMSNHLAYECPLLQNKDEIFKLNFRNHNYKTDQDLEDILELVNKKKPIFKDNHTKFFYPRQVEVKKSKRRQTLRKQKNVTSSKSIVKSKKEKDMLNSSRKNLNSSKISEDDDRSLNNQNNNENDDDDSLEGYKGKKRYDDSLDYSKIEEVDENAELDSENEESENDNEKSEDESENNNKDLNKNTKSDIQQKHKPELIKNKDIFIDKRDRNLIQDNTNNYNKELKKGKTLFGSQLQQHSINSKRVSIDPLNSNNNKYNNKKRASIDLLDIRNKYDSNNSKKRVSINPTDSPNKNGKQRFSINQLDLSSKNDRKHVSYNQKDLNYSQKHQNIKRSSKISVDPLDIRDKYTSSVDIDFNIHKKKKTLSIKDEQNPYNLHRNQSHRNSIECRSSKKHENKDNYFSGRANIKDHKTSTINENINNQQRKKLTSDSFKLIDKNDDSNRMNKKTFTIIDHRPNQIARHNTTLTFNRKNKGVLSFKSIEEKYFQEDKFIAD